MILNPQQIATREKLILAGLYLAKYDSLGLEKLGFEGFKEAFNVIGYAMGSQPASIKNYRDEFDPLFPNPRKGWHKRPIRGYCLKVFDKYQDLDLESFTGLIRSLFGHNKDAWREIQEEDEEESGSSFAKRLITGLAAEQYFVRVQPGLPELGDYGLEDTTHFGCGYDFRLRTKAHDDFMAVEVKGLAERTGCLYLTRKEHATAAALKGRFILFVVKNFQEVPFHEIYQNPLSSKLQFNRKERTIIQVSWSASV